MVRLPDWSQALPRAQTGSAALVSRTSQRPSSRLSRTCQACSTSCHSRDSNKDTRSARPVQALEPLSKPLTKLSASGRDQVLTGGCTRLVHLSAEGLTLRDRRKPLSGGGRSDNIRVSRMLTARMRLTGSDRWDVGWGTQVVWTVVNTYCPEHKGRLQEETVMGH